MTNRSTVYLNIYSNKFKICSKNSKDQKQIMQLSKYITNHHLHKYYTEHTKDIVIADSYKTYCIEYGDFDGVDYSADEVLNLLTGRKVIVSYLNYILRNMLDMYPGTTPMVCTKNRNIILCRRPVPDIIHVNILNYEEIIKIILANENQRLCMIL